jgi:hypothetical protein
MSSNIPSISAIQYQLQNLKTKRDAVLSKSGSVLTQPEINQLKEIYTEQLELYNLVNDLNSTYENVLNSSKTLNVYQQNLNNKLVDINNDLEKELEEIDSKQIDKIQQAKINRYYSDKYENQVHLMKIITRMLVAVILLAILRNNGLIMNDAFNVLIIVILIIGGIFLLKQFIDILRRSNMDFQEIKWNFVIPESL